MRGKGLSRRKLLGFIVTGSAVAALPQPVRGVNNLRSIAYGETKEGEIDSSDPERAEYNGYYEPVSFDGEEGDVVTIQMTSSGDPLLRLQAPSGDIVATDDDGYGSGLNSEIADFELGETGEYTIIATSYYDDASFEYTLSLEAESEPENITGPQRTIVIYDNVYHLGDGEYTRAINSQFQVPAQGDSFTTTFNLDGSEANPGDAQLIYDVRGAEEDNPLYINGVYVGSIDTSPSDGSIDTQSFSVVPRTLQSGINELTIEAASDGFGSDDLEVSDIVLGLSGIQPAPQPAFTLSPDDVKLGEEITLDASGSTDPNGSIVDYQWDIDDDGSFEFSGEQVSFETSIAGNVPITLAVTDEQGAVSELTEDVPIGFRFLDREEKMDVAESLDDSSVLSYLEDITDADIRGDPELAADTLDALSSAVNDGTISQVTAESAFSRHQLAEDATKEILSRLDGGEGLARQTAELAVKTVVDIGTLIVAIKAGAAAAGGAVVKAGVVTAVTILTDAVKSFLDAILPSGDHNIKNKLFEDAKIEIQGIMGQIINGTISTAGDIADVVEPVVDTLVDTFGAALQAFVELESYNTVIQATQPGMSGLSPTCVYGSLRELDQQLQPDILAEQGLSGDTTTSIALKEETVSRITEAMEGTLSEIEAYGRVASEFNIYDIILDLVQTGDPSEFIQLAIKAAKGVAGLLANLAGTTTGALSFILVKQTHAQLMEGIWRGEQVPFTYV